LSPSRRVLVVGGGGREHALAWKLARDGADVLVAPGNAGTAAIAENVPVAADDIPGLVALARDRGVELTVVGPEAALVAGIVDAFAAASLRIFGPSAEAAQLEGSKIFCKKMPTAWPPGRACLSAAIGPRRSRPWRRWPTTRSLPARPEAS